MNYLKKYASEAAFDAAPKNGANTPHVGWCQHEGTVRYYARHNAGDVVYWDGSKLNTIWYENWVSTLGTPIGVVCIPGGLLPDGKCRMISPWWVNASGGNSSSVVNLAFRASGSHGRPIRGNIVTWNNTYPSTYGSSTSTTYYSTDMVTSNKCASDPQAGYSSSPFAVPSYNKDGTWNQDMLRNNSALADFDGKGNTAAMANSAYTAAYACSLHTTSGTAAGDWYLASVGEWSMTMARQKTIDAACAKCGGVAVNQSSWTSTAQSSSYVWGASVGSRNFNCYYATNTYGVRPFAALEL